MTVITMSRKEHTGLQILIGLAHGRTSSFGTVRSFRTISSASWFSSARRVRLRLAVAGSRLANWRAPVTSTGRNSHANGRLWDSPQANNQAMDRAIIIEQDRHWPCGDRHAV